MELWLTLDDSYQRAMGKNLNWEGVEKASSTLGGILRFVCRLNALSLHRSDGSRATKEADARQLKSAVMRHMCSSWGQDSPSYTQLIQLCSMVCTERKQATQSHVAGSETQRLDPESDHRPTDCTDTEKQFWKRGQLGKQGPTLARREGQAANVKTEGYKGKAFHGFT